MLYIPTNFFPSNDKYYTYFDIAFFQVKQRLFSTWKGVNYIVMIVSLLFSKLLYNLKAKTNIYNVTSSVEWFLFLVHCKLIKYWDVY